MPLHQRLHPVSVVSVVRVNVELHGVKVPGEKEEALRQFDAKVPQEDGRDLLH